MKISIIGLGYVGTVTGICLAKEGNQVIGVDKNKVKVKQLMNLQSPMMEPGLHELIVDVVSKGSFRATVDTEDAILSSDVSLISVGTYSSADGYADLRAIYNVVDEIGSALKKKKDFHTIVIRSTVPPGTTSVAMRHVEKSSGKRLGLDFGGGMNPEFLREGSALHDFYNPPFIIVGTEDDKTGKLLEEMYSFIKVLFFRTEIELAEIIKYSCNAFHAIKVSFANEIGRVCAASNIDGQKLMDIFVKDRILNISEKYLRPGVPFGGSCLPKDLKALVSFSKSKGVQVPLLDSILDSNDSHFAEILRRIEELECSTIGILGITFKENTDDVRESSILKLMRCLIDRGFMVKFYDINLDKQKIIGSNKELLVRVLPEYEEIQVEDIKMLLDNTDLIVITNGQYLENDELSKLLQTGRTKIFDLNGQYRVICPSELYYGLCWR